MRRQDGVDSEAMAVLGGSRGGELALLRGTTFFEIHATVAYVPVDLQWEGMGQPGKDDPAAAHRIHEGFRPSYILFILRITQHFRLHCRGGVARTTAFDFAGQLWLRPQRRWGRPCTRRPCRFVSSRELSATSLTWSIPDSIAALAPSRLNHLADPTGVGGLVLVQQSDGILLTVRVRHGCAQYARTRGPSYSRSAWTLSSSLIRLRRAPFPGSGSDGGRWCSHALVFR
jgi:hypothetical protein